MTARDSGEHTLGETAGISRRSAPAATLMPALTVTISLLGLGLLWSLAANAWPSRAFVVGTDGRVLYSTRLTELEFHADEMDAVLRRVASPQTAAGVK